MKIICLFSKDQTRTLQLSHPEEEECTRYQTYTTFWNPGRKMADHFPGKMARNSAQMIMNSKARATVTDITSTSQHVKSKLLQVEKNTPKTLSISEKALQNNIWA